MQGIYYVQIPSVFHEEFISHGSLIKRKHVCEVFVTYVCNLFSFRLRFTPGKFWSFSLRE